jgi:peptidoglycan lytic transglycosylase F
MDGNKYNGLIKAAVQMFWPQVDWRLIKAQMRAESAFDPRAVSHCGACGLMQLMPETAEELGVRDIFNPAENITGGVRHLKKMFDIFKTEKGEERLKFALGAYNDGQGHIIEAQKLALEANRPPDKWSSIAASLPAVTGQHAEETVNYVEKIFRFWAEYKEENQ